MIFKELRQHPYDYLVLMLLTGVIVAGILSDVRASTQQLLSVVLGFAYAGWGIWHHRRQKNLSVRVAMEYTLMGLVVSLLLFAVTAY